MIAEPPGRAHQPYELPDEDGAEDQRHQLEADRGDELPAHREARLHELDAMERAVDVGYRQAQEGNGDQHIGGHLVGDLIGKVEPPARDDVDAYYDEHD